MTATLQSIDRVLATAVDAALAAGANDAEVSYVGHEIDFVRFASSRFTQVGATRDDAVRVRVIADGRLGSQMSASLDPDELARTAAAAVEVARLTPPLDVDIGFATTGTGQSGDAPAVHPSLTATGAPALLAQAFAPHRDAGVLFAGALKSQRSTRAVRTAGGCARGACATACDAQLIALTGASSGYAGVLAGADAPLDLPALAATAADKAVRGIDPVDLPPGRYDVVLAPAAIAELLEWMAMVSFGANALIDGTSLLTGRQGQPLVDPRITLADRPGPDDIPFDAEGTEIREVAMIDAGAGGRVVTDRISAARLADDRGSTGHAPAIDDDFATGPAPSHLVLETGDQTEEQLIGAVDRGLYLTRLHYVNGLLNPRKATTTGMTRDGSFLIENGEISRGVANLRFTEHLLEALSRVGGVGSVPVRIPTWWSDGGSITCPPILLRDFQFTGRSR